jgi:anti-sigma regulatory factor (Ser/Thr protein kinase)
MKLLRTAVTALAAWTGVAMLFTLYVMLPSPAAGHIAEWGRATAWQLVDWWSWAACTPLVVAAARRLVTRRPLPLFLALHLASGVVVSGFCTAVQGALKWLLFSGVRIRYEIVGASSLPMVDSWSFNLVVYAMVVGAFYVLRAGWLEAQLTRARLDALSARLRPHFLFNTLNTISALVPEDPKAANRMIGRLSELLRQAFDHGGQTEITLEEELRLLGHYVAIQEQRFGDRLRVHVDVGHTARQGLVPTLLLQPLVENAVSHGMSVRNSKVRVTVHVEAARRADQLRIVVRDDGPGFSACDGNDTGVGLSATRERIAERYGAAQSFDLSNAPDGGAVVTIEIPFVDNASADR